jgi:hypothetical protein
MESLEAEFTERMSVLVELIKTNVGINRINYEIQSILHYFNNDINVQNTLIYYISKCKLDHTYHINSQDNSHKDIVLITQFFIASTQQRQYELDTCLTLNILNDDIHEILLFTEKFINIKQHINQSIKFKQILKVRQIIIEKRLTLYESITKCVYPNKIYIISNSDIFFTETINILKKINLDNKIFALSRYDLVNNYNTVGQNECKIFTHEGTFGDPVIDSHDAWIMNSNIKNDIKLDIPLGTCGIDNIANYIFIENGYEICNPVFDINIIHYHIDKNRNDTVNGIRNNSGSIVYDDYTTLGLNVKYIQQQKLQVIHNIESICTMCTNMSYHTDLVFLLNSIKQYEPNMNIYILCDTFVYNKILIDFPTLYISRKIGLDSYSNMNRKQMESNNTDLFKDLCFEKINCVNFALEQCSNTLYLDADIILFNKLNLHIPIDCDIALCPHYILKENTDLYGYYNAGMMFIANKNICTTWENCKSTARFLDQSCLEDISKIYKTFELDYTYNYGWWRLFQCDNSQERLDKFKICENTNVLLYDYIPIKCIHTHIYEVNDTQTQQFNNIIIKLIENNPSYTWLLNILNHTVDILPPTVDIIEEDIDNNKLNIIYIPKQPRNDNYSHKNDTFRELVKLWEIAKLVKIEEYDGQHIYFNNINDILLYDRPTLDWLNNENYNIGLFGNPNLPNNSKINSSWIFWARHPELLNNYITNNLLKTYNERYINSIFIGNIENNIQEQYRSNQWCKYIDFFEMTNNIDGKYKYTHQNYLHLLSFSKYGLCIRGFGTKCNREIEYLALGVVPLITSEISIEYYNKLIENIHYIKINSYEDILKLDNITEEQWNIMSTNCIEWYNDNCSILGSYETTINIITEIKKSQNYIKLNKNNILEHTETIETPTIIEHTKHTETPTIIEHTKHKETPTIIEHKKHKETPTIIEHTKHKETPTIIEHTELPTNKNIIVNEGIQVKFIRQPPYSLDNIEQMLEIHNNKHTPINWKISCNFERIQQIYIEKIDNNIKYLHNNGELSNNRLKFNHNNIIKFESNSDDVFFNLVQPWGYGYYHFICEILPRILFYIKNEHYFKDKNIFFILYFNNTFIQQAIELLPHVQNIQIIQFDNDKIYDIHNINTYMITPTVCGNPSQEGIQLIRQYYLPNIAPIEECCIIIKRNETDRSIENFDEVFNYIKSVFPNEKWIIFESSTLNETRYLFNNAKLVIGAHGAGLSNLVFANENIYVLELSPANNFNCCYWHLSNLLKQNHTIMPIYNYDGNNSFKVNIEQLKKYIVHIYNKIKF